MSTSPTFDANKLDEQWSTWMEDEAAPLLNRPTQALYPPGTTTGGVLLARFLSQYTISTAVPATVWNTTPESEYFCAIAPGMDNTWGELVSSGCIKALATINRSSTLSDTLDLYAESGLFQIQNLPLEVSQVVQVQEIQNYSALYSGAAGILVSPVQVAVMASSLSNDGHVIIPQIAMSYKPTQSDWSLIDIVPDPNRIQNFKADEAARLLTGGDFPGWEISSLASFEKARIAWYVAGTPTDWIGTPITLVVALEDGSALDARRIGRELFMSATARIQD
jgi:hypothetical protein